MIARKREEVPPLFASAGKLPAGALKTMREALHPPVRADHPDTSHEAAASIAEATPTLRAKVLEAIRSAQFGLTDEEGIAATGMSPSTYRPRRGELEAMQLVVDSGDRRNTVSGRKAIVWRAK